jgi:hypothetical protein
MQQANKNFGTGINKHPVEFSNNQHTPPTNPPQAGQHPGQLPHFTRSLCSVKLQILNLGFSEFRAHQAHRFR